MPARALLKPLLALVGGLMTTPLGLLAAVALGPVILGALCATVFGLVVFAVWSGLVALVMLAQRAYVAIAGRGGSSGRGPRERSTPADLTPRA